MDANVNLQKRAIKLGTKSSSESCEYLFTDSFLTMVVMQCGSNLVDQDEQAYDAFLH